MIGIPQRIYISGVNEIRELIVREIWKQEFNLLEEASSTALVKTHYSLEHIRGYYKPETEAINVQSI